MYTFLGKGKIKILFIISYCLFILTITLNGIGLFYLSYFENHNFLDEWVKLIYQIDKKSGFEIETERIFNNLKHDFDKIVEQNDNLSQSNLDWDFNKHKLSFSRTENKNENKAIPAVVIDLDNTLLSTVYFQIYLKYYKKNFDKKLFDNFILKKKAFLYKGVKNFIEYVFKNHGAVFFTSDRDQKKNLIEATKNNLIENCSSCTNKIESEKIEKELIKPDWLWWLKGVNLAEKRAKNKLDKIDKQIYGKELKEPILEKEDRFYAIGNFPFKVWNCDGDNCNGNEESSYHTFQVVMRIGDDIHKDFNSNLFSERTISTFDDKLCLAEKYFSDKNIKNNFLTFGEQVWFRNEKKKEKFITTKYFDTLSSNLNNEKFDRNTLKKWTKFKKTERQNVRYEMYRRIAFIGNIDYGSYYFLLKKRFPNERTLRSYLENILKENNLTNHSL